MAKKAAKVVVVAEGVNSAAEQLLGSMDIPALNQLVHDAQQRIQSLEVGTKDERVAAFKKSDFYKGLKQKMAAFNAEIKAALKQKGTVEATIRFSATTSQEYDLEDGVYQGYDELFELSAEAGKVSGEGLSKEQKERIQQAVDEFVCDMCDDGFDLFFPKLRDVFQDIENRVSEFNDELETELSKHSLSVEDILQ